MEGQVVTCKIRDLSGTSDISEVLIVGTQTEGSFESDSETQDRDRIRQGDLQGGILKP